MKAERGAVALAELLGDVVEREPRPVGQLDVRDGAEQPPSVVAEVGAEVALDRAAVERAIGAGGPARTGDVDLSALGNIDRDRDSMHLVPL